MARYFIEVAYQGTRFRGFQSQQNAVTVQGEIERALSVLLRGPVVTTGSSRTDAGVHAFQNYLHFDTEVPLMAHFTYKLNAVLSPDVAVRSLHRVAGEAHARFDAVSRAYRYRIYYRKDPFLREGGYYFPYRVDDAVLERTAAMVAAHRDFASFSKRNTQVKTFRCEIRRAVWYRRDDQLIFEVEANRFLRGMVRGLVGTMLKTARGSLLEEEFAGILSHPDNTRTDFSVPAQGLFLTAVRYPDDFPWGEPVL